MNKDIVIRELLLACKLARSDMAYEARRAYQSNLPVSLRIVAGANMTSIEKVLDAAIAKAEKVDLIRNWWEHLKLTIRHCHNKCNGARWPRFFHVWDKIEKFQQWEQEWDEEAGDGIIGLQGVRDLMDGKEPETGNED